MERQVYQRANLLEPSIKPAIPEKTLEQDERRRLCGIRHSEGQVSSHTLTI